MFASLVFESRAYAFNPHALATLATALTGALIGILTLRRERGSRVALPFALITLCLSVWMTGSTMMYLSQIAEVAEFWARFGQLFIAFIPALAFLFAVRLVNRIEQLRYYVYVAMLISSSFFAMVLFSDLHTSGIYRHPWGFYPRYGPAGLLFVAYISLMLGACMYLLWRAYGLAEQASITRRRIRLLLVGIGIAGLSAVDVLATFGLPVYPFGFVMLFVFFCIMALITWHYHLIDITPAVASRKIIETMSDALLVMDENARISLINPAASTLLGIPEAELIGTQADKHLAGLQLGNILKELDSQQVIRNRQVPFREAKGARRVLNVSASRMHDRHNTSLASIMVMSDITERTTAEERVKFLAFNDELTRLPNRLNFYARLEEELQSANQNNRRFTVLYLDLDRFRRINETLGHIAGDDLLCAVAERLKNRLENPAAGSNFPSMLPNGFVARVGADEFALAMASLVDLNDIRSFAGRLLEDIGQPFMLGEHEVTISASIGIAQYPQHGDDTKNLFKNADSAMYHAKDAGRNTFRLYNDDMKANTADRLALENDLRRAVERNELELYYQPQFDGRCRSVVGCEALLRWHHPERGMISPMVFIPLAEEVGLIHKIGEWVLNAACRQAQLWQTAGFKDLKVAVNLSGHQFRQSNLVLVVAQALIKSGLDARLLELELTEGIIMRNVVETTRTLGELKSMGIGISVDDFGTGYSSLSYLKRLPIDVIKIDRSFVSDISTDADDRAITDAIIGLAHSLRKSVIAEGVETEEQVAFLAQRDCHIMQGYLFSKPLPATSFTELLRGSEGKTHQMP
ncbi:MAG: EAL domain-containing protein [Gammaproteobacteria bacterium]|nr:EAL domain-containing protein [Gammaproteobacteria bacterium]